MNDSTPPIVPCCNYQPSPSIPWPVMWNPFNKVVQCHNCGHVWEPKSYQPTFADALRIARGCLVKLGDDRDGAMAIGALLTVLESASHSGLNDPQVAALWKMGGEK